jgi:4-carboxymuconolactone decarboxylase
MTMARIDPPQKPGILSRLFYRVAKRQMGGDEIPEPVPLYAHTPKIMHGYGMFELGFKSSKKAPMHLKLLMELKAGAAVGCEWCLDYATFVARGEGMSEEQLRALPTFRDSDLFDSDEKLVLEYAEGMSRTPVDVPEELVKRLRERFSDAQIAELTWAGAIENLRARFNWALGIGSQGYVGDAFCVVPERLPEKTEAAA